MPDKLTDKEIVKALPFLAKCCKDEYNDIRVDKVLLGAFDLINRLQVENKRLKRYYYQHEYDKWEKEIKAEAYKEFAEKVIKHIEGKAFNLELMRSLYTQQSAFALRRIAEDIDNLLKELVGEDK